jgi:hypothetical protein
MRFHGLDLNLLVALDALLPHQNVTRAAEQLNLSQSALSGALARLREHFDDELVVPIGRRMEPTPLARTLAEPLHEILLKTKSLVTTTASFDPRLARDVAQQFEHKDLGRVGNANIFLVEQTLVRMAFEGETLRNDPQVDFAAVEALERF